MSLNCLFQGLIDLINETFTKDGSLDSNILEIGCGSGAISLSLVKENPKVWCSCHVLYLFTYRIKRSRFHYIFIFI